MIGRQDEQQGSRTVALEHGVRGKRHRRGRVAPDGLQEIRAAIPTLEPRVREFVFAEEVILAVGDREDLPGRAFYGIEHEGRTTIGFVQ